MFIKEINRASSALVENKERTIICRICKSNSKIIARRNTKWITLCFLEVLEIKKYPAYAACSNCLNALPSDYTICKQCTKILPGKNMYCTECQKESLYLNKKSVSIQSG
ncbi:hypothetical protein NEIG_00424 [Nematocida sp. ERTm5]|nr:hypothetical protein NEIRO02_1687 [Nematocida sp. AWRm79]KAI5184879.1 hypothetical protein NEIRO03_1884 [Nematocida sp. AWRm78]OAG30940.1 hypothetical protein NEIG_00424 [Nematocida sp. ERTm5]